MAKLLIVEDSPLTRNEIKIIALKSGLFSEVITASTGEEGIKQVVKHKPDACILDLEMPRIGGFSFLKWVMSNHPIPVLVFSSANTQENILKALELGAVDFLPKEKKYISTDLKEKLTEKLSILLNAKPKLTKNENEKKLREIEPIKPLNQNNAFKLIVIGASTGGPTAVQNLLKEIDGKISLPIIICQHMPKNFTTLFAQRLNSLLKNYEVKEAKNGENITTGRIYVCPGDSHIVMSGKKITIIPSKASDLYSPCIDITLESAATYYKEHLLAIILTGMGKDGLEGCKKVKRNRGTIIIESPESCIVYGMPREIARNKLFDYQLPLNRIGDKIVELITEN